MKKHLNIFLTLILALALGSCSKENPFLPDGNEGEGTILKSALQVELQNAEGHDQVLGRPGLLTRATLPTADEFTVNFYLEGEEAPVAAYKFGEMPEIVTLPAGAITAVATYGDNAAQAWDAPYYKGQTTFVVVADRVTDDIDPIVAGLANVRVSIVFAPSLKAVMSPDSKVTVVVGEKGTLDFTQADEERSGYFAYVEDSKTLAATFNGKVDGFSTRETKGYDNVAPGNHYRITFKLHDAMDDGEGDANGSLTVDASVEVVDMNVSVADDDNILDDDLRPVEGTEDPTPGPGPGGDEPGGDTPALPVIGPKAAPAGMTGIKFDEWNVVDVDKTYCAFNISSSAAGGIKGLTVVIDSPNLTEDELATIGLAKNLDLVNPGALAEPLQGLGFPVNVGGMTSVDFDITSFLGLLAVFGPNDHKFIVTVTDANGTVTKSLQLRFL